MPVTPIKPQQVSEITHQLGLQIADVESYARLINSRIPAFDALDSMPDDLPPVRYSRTAAYKPSVEENPYNAWYYKTRISGAPNGKLKGKTIALKDNVFLAGVPMLNGSATLDGYVPDFDATIVTRILDAGGEILGKAHCEWFCHSGSSYTNVTGPIQNPRKLGYSAGGSSSGSAALVAAGEVDMAIGTDQGGSIRIPSSFCGIYGMKPTYGLVPYTGIQSLEPLLDHVGPMTSNVWNNALLLEVIAGADGYDDRQANFEPPKYSEMIATGTPNLKVAVVREGFAHPNSDPDVDNKVRRAANICKQLGFTVDDVSIPMHAAARALFLPIAVEGVGHVMNAGDTMGLGRAGVYSTSLMDFHRDRRLSAEFPPLSVLTMILEKYIVRQFGHHYYGKAINLVRRLRASYNAVLKDYDLLLMPTSPIKACPLPDSSWSLEDRANRSFDMGANTVAFDLTHHPAMNVPCGVVDGLPIGMMLIGRHYEEATIYRAAHAFEQAEDWTKL